MQQVNDQDRQNEWVGLFNQTKDLVPHIHHLMRRQERELENLVNLDLWFAHQTESLPRHRTVLIDWL